MKNYEQILQEHQLKKTPIRVAVLELFLEVNHGLSPAEINKQLATSHDRVTIYRTLNKFEEKGMLHRVPDADSGLRYALCSQHCPDEAHLDYHAHFICRQCQNTFCLENVAVPSTSFPKHVQVEEVQYTLTGLCEGCK